MFIYCFWSIPNLILNKFRALLRHGISIWIDVPLDIVAMVEMEDQSQSPVSNFESDLEVLFYLINL